MPENSNTQSDFLDLLNPEKANNGTGSTTNTREEVDYKDLFLKEQARRRGLQSERDRLKNELSKTVVTLKEFEKSYMPKLSSVERDELEDLKDKDPEAWKDRLETIQEEKRAEIQKSIDTLTEEQVEEANKQSFNAAVEDLAEQYPDFKDVLDENTLEEDIPSKYTTKFKKGELTAKQFLEEAYKFLKKSRNEVINPSHENIPNLRGKPGSSRPSEEATRADFTQAYETGIL